MRANEIMENELSSRDTLRLERATKSFEAGFETEAARKQAMSDVSGVYEGLRDQVMKKLRPLFWEAQDDTTGGPLPGKEAQYEEMRDLMDSIPFNLNQIREKHFSVFEKYGDLPLLKKLVQLRAAMKDAPLVAKKRDLEKAAAKAAAESSIIAKATQPLKEEALRETQKKADAFAASIKRELEEHNFDVSAIVPPLPSLGRNVDVWSPEYKEYQNRKKTRDAERNVYLQFLKRDADGYSWSSQLEDHYVQVCLEGVAQQYDSFVAKMNHKIENPVAAEFAWVRNVWGDSRLLVTLADGTKELWQTKIILNVSKLGKLFNQWPTRRLK